jgi:hypothetical protein
MSETSPNRAARLARGAMRAAWRDSRASRFAGAFIVILALSLFTMWASWRHSMAANASPGPVMFVFDLLYAPFTYLAPQSGYAYGQELYWQQAVARVVGPMLPLLGLFWLLRRRVLIAFAALCLRRLGDGHVMMLGSDGSADVLAIATSNGGTPVVLRDPTLAGDLKRQAALGAAGVLWFHDAAEPLEVAAARREAAHAAVHAVWRHADVDSLVDAIGWRDALQAEGRDILVSVRSLDAQHALRHSPGLLQVSRSRLRPVSLDGVAMRTAFNDAALVVEARKRGQPAVTACLWGGGPSLSWCAEMLLRQNWSIHLGAPRLLLAEGAEAGLAEGVEGLVRHGAAVFDAEHVPLIERIAGRGDTIDRDVTRHIVDYGDDDRTLSEAFALATWLSQAMPHPPAVQAVLRTEAGVAQLFARTGLSFAAPILPLQRLNMDALVNRPQDARAAALHMDYERRHGGDGLPASGRWQDLSETYVQSNRAAADHIAVKLRDAELAELSGRQLVDRLAQAEHWRWCAERLLDGWIPGQPRDNARRIHPDLTPWAMLDEAARDKDRAQILVLGIGQDA